MSTFDAIIVGGGHNGLVAAVELARAGWQTVVLEQSDRLGGAVRSEEITLPGFVHDLYSTNQNTFRGGLVYGELGAELERHGLRYASTDKPFANAFRPLPGYSGYRTPVDGLFITGAATWPGGGVTGLPGQLAAKAVLKATRRRGWR